MFLTAVLQAHTDSLTETGHDNVATAKAALEDTSLALKRLRETLAVPAQQRIQTLPNAHRSRWI